MIPSIGQSVCKTFLKESICNQSYGPAIGLAAIAGTSLAAIAIFKKVFASNPQPIINAPISPVVDTTMKKNTTVVQRKKISPPPAPKPAPKREIDYCQRLENLFNQNGYSFTKDNFVKLQMPWEYKRLSYVPARVQDLIVTSLRENKRKTDQPIMWGLDHLGNKIIWLNLTRKEGLRETSEALIFFQEGKKYQTFMLDGVLQKETKVLDFLKQILQKEPFNEYEKTVSRPAYGTYYSTAPGLNVFGTTTWKKITYKLMDSKSNQEKQ